MRRKMIFMFFLTTVTLFLASFAIPNPDATSGSANKESIRIAYQSQCEGTCNKGGKWPLCGSDGCTYTGYKELQCYQNCGKNVTIVRKEPCYAPQPKTSYCPRAGMQ